MALEQRDMWEAFHQSLPREHMLSWEKLSTLPKKVGSKWTSVFVMESSAGMQDLHMPQRSFILTLL